MLGGVVERLGEGKLGKLTVELARLGFLQGVIAQVQLGSYLRDPVGGCGAAGSEGSEQFAVGAETYKLEVVGVGLTVNQEQVGADMALTTVLPLLGQFVVLIALWEGCVGGKQRDGLGKEDVELGANRPGPFALIVAFEDAGALNLPGR